MRAITYRQYGGPNVLRLTDLPKPRPGPDEILIRIRATTVTTADWRARSLHMPAGFRPFGRPAFGLFGPRRPTLGTELAGTVEAIGEKVVRFTVGNKVFAFTGAKFGCHAEYRTIPQDGLVALKPDNLSFEEAAALSFGGTTALHYLRDKAELAEGEKVLIVGASGSVGSAAVQIARHLGAEVTSVCSTSNLELVRGLGAHDVIDYTKEDFADTGRTWDIIMDTTGTAPFSRCGGALRTGGRLLTVLGSLRQTLGMERPPKSSGKKSIAGVATSTQEQIDFLANMASTGSLRPVIDRIYSLEDAAEAHAYVETGRKRGNVVLGVT